MTAFIQSDHAVGYELVHNFYGALEPHECGHYEPSGERFTLTVAFLFRGTSAKIQRFQAPQIGRFS